MWEIFGPNHVWEKWQRGRGWAGAPVQKDPFIPIRRVRCPTQRNPMEPNTIYTILSSPPPRDIHLQINQKLDWHIYVCKLLSWVLKTLDNFAHNIAQLNLGCCSCGTQVLQCRSEMRFSGKQEIMRAQCSWMDWAEEMDSSVDQDLPNSCLLLPRFSCGARNLTSVVRGMLPITISWKENKVIISLDGFSSSFIWAGNPVLSVALFDITLALIFWLSISTHKASN